MTQQEVIARLKKLLTERLRLPSERIDALKPASLLLEDGLGLDSLDCIELLLGIEDEFDLELQEKEEEEGWIQHFSTLDQLSRLVIHTKSDAA